MPIGRGSEMAFISHWCILGSMRADVWVSHMEWNSLHPRAVIRVSFVLAAMLGGPASAQAPAPAEPSRIRIEYKEPTNPDHTSIYKRLKQRGVLEDYKDFLAPLKLQDPV